MVFESAWSSLRLVLTMLAAVVLTSACGDAVEPVSDRLLTVGLVTNNPNGLRNIRGFQEGLRQLGYLEGVNLKYLFANKPIPKTELVPHIESMVANGAELIFTAGTPTGTAAKKATRKSNIPVVFGVIADPIAAGVMDDLDRPGSNMTGIMLSKNQARRLELLHRFVPHARHILLPYNPDDPAPTSSAVQLEEVATALGLKLVHAFARSDAEVDLILDQSWEDIDAIFMLPDSTVNRQVTKLMARAVERKLPVSGPSLAQVEAGAVISYGIVHREVGIQAAYIADRVLRGSDPAAIPVEIADFFLTINLAAAARIGLEFSEGTLQQADRILRQDQFGE